MTDALSPADEVIAERACAIAAHAMQAAVNKDTSQANEWLRALAILQNEANNSVPVQAALATWADAYVTNVVGEPEPDRAIALAFADTEFTRRMGADEVDPAALWAGRWIVARGRMDRDMCDALWADLVERDEEGFNDCLTALLTCTAAAIRAKLMGHYPTGKDFGRD